MEHQNLLLLLQNVHKSLELFEDTLNKYSFKDVIKFLSPETQTAS